MWDLIFTTKIPEGVFRFLYVTDLTLHNGSCMNLQADGLLVIPRRKGRVDGMR